MAKTSQVPRVVVVTRHTDLELLVARHGTRDQAAFFLRSRGQDLGELEQRQHRFEAALHQTLAAIPPRWRRTRVVRDDLDCFLFEPNDILVALGQDGLVANVAKYLRGQRVVGVNPEPDRYDGILVPHPPERAEAMIRASAEASAGVEARTMVEAELDDGQRLLALNEIFLGHRTHQSARYRIDHEGAHERQSSSGIITSTGTGATGWARSVHRQRRTELRLPSPQDACLAFFVREAFPSRATGTTLTDGLIPEGTELTVVSEMNDDGVLFGDGIEDDRVSFGWGMSARVRVADVRLMLVRE